MQKNAKLAIGLSVVVAFWRLVQGCVQNLFRAAGSVDKLAKNLYNGIYQKAPAAPAGAGDKRMDFEFIDVGRKT